MGVLSGWFLAIVVVLAIARRVLPWRVAWTVLFTLANVLFLASFAKGYRSLGALLGFALLGYVFTWVLRKRPSRPLLGVLVVVMVALFAVLRQYALVKPLFPIANDLFVTIGLSYLLFRVLHLMIDAGSGTKIEGLSPVRYFNYGFSLFTLVSGPIQRFEDFVREEEKEPTLLDGTLVLDTATRAIVGLVKILWLAPVAMSIHKLGLAALTGAPSPLARSLDCIQLAITMLGYLLFLYWNFSGSMDLVIAGAALVGMKLPENFDKPFRAPNFIDFWSRWHITLSDWFRFYLFNPIVAFFTRLKTDVKLAPYYGVVGFFITFFVMGVWHGTTSVFLIYGLYLGAGVSLNKLYQVKMRDWLGKERLKRLNRNPLYKRLANALTISYYALGLAGFWVDAKLLKALEKKLRVVDLVEAVGVGVVAVLVVVAVIDVLDRLGGKEEKQRATPAWVKEAAIALVVVAMLLLGALGNSKAPAFVYAEF